MEQGESQKGYQSESDVIEITNEFATVYLRKVRTRNGERLEIRSPKLGYKTYLDPLQLESLTWSNKKLFHKLLATPFGE